MLLISSQINHILLVRIEVAMDALSCWTGRIFPLPLFEGGVEEHAAFDEMVCQINIGWR